MTEPRDMRASILAAARTAAQAHGYAGLSFRELAKATGIRSASVHYHFPTKGDLAAELARAYTAAAQADMAAIEALEIPLGDRLARYAALFRKALADDNRMCLCGLLAAEHDALPASVQAEVAAFARANVDWLAAQVAPRCPTPDAARRRAEAIHAAIAGAQLSARGAGDIDLFDRIVGTYVESGLIPG